MMFQGICKEKRTKVNDFGFPKYGSWTDTTTYSYLMSHDLADDLAYGLAKVYDLILVSGLKYNILTENHL